MSYAEIAMDFGCQGIRVTDPEELAPAIRAASEERALADMHNIIGCIRVQKSPVQDRDFCIFYWNVFEELVAIALLIGGGLTALQAAAISTGLPFAIVLAVMCVSIFTRLRAEKR